MLWAYEPSPFCRVVRERLVELEIPHLFRSTARGSAKRQEMFDKYGKFQAPLLEVRSRRPRESRHPWCWVAVCSVTLASNGWSCISALAVLGGRVSRRWRLLGCVRVFVTRTKLEGPVAPPGQQTSTPAPSVYA